MGKQSNIGGHAVHRNAAQGRVLVEQWRQSGLSVSEFCRRQGVGAHVLRYWLSRAVEPAATTATGGAFYVVSARNAESAEIAQASMGGQGREGGAVIVVLPAVTSEQLVRTLRWLLEEGIPSARWWAAGEEIPFRTPSIHSQFWRAAALERRRRHFSQSRRSQKRSNRGAGRSR